MWMGLRTRSATGRGTEGGGRLRQRNTLQTTTGAAIVANIKRLDLQRIVDVSKHKFELNHSTQKPRSRWPVFLT